MAGVSPRRKTDAACLLALFVLGGALAFWTTAQFRQSGLLPEFYQREFAPAVMFACGRGFRNVDRSADPALAAFLLLQRNTLPCAEIREGLTETPLDPFQRGSLYMEWAVAATWRIGGVSWPAVTWLSALLAGFSGAMMYAVMRLGMRPFAAATLAIMVVSSPLHLSFVPHLRDYSKAPFLLALVLLMGVMVTRVLSLGSLLRLALLAGVTAAVGFGFRTDLLLGVAAFLITLFLFRAAPSGIPGRLRDSSAAAVLFLAAFASTAAPVLSGYAKGDAMAHVVLLGFSGNFNTGLGVDAKHYELYVPYNDLFQEAVIRSYVSRSTGDTRTIAVGSLEYERASTRYLLDVVRLLPADAVIRSIAALTQVLNAPFSESLSRLTTWVHSPAMRRLYEKRASALVHGRGLGWAAAATVLAGVAFSSIRCAAFLVFVVVFLAGGTAMQFSPRHYFYLEFMSWWAIGAAGERAVTTARHLSRVVRRREWRIREGLVGAGPGLLRAAAVVAAIILTTATVLWATRHRQQHNVNQLLERVLAAERQPLRTSVVPAGADTVRVTLDLPELALSPGSWQSHGIGTAYLLIDVDPARCDSFAFSGRLRYEATIRVSDFTSSLNVPLMDAQAGASVKILLPVYAAWFIDGRLQRSTFSGIEVSPHAASCITSISKVNGLESFPLLPTAVLGRDWRMAWHYQTMTRLERREDGALWDERFYPAQPASLEVPRAVLSQPATDFWPGAATSSRAALAMSPSGMAVAGTPESPFTYLAVSRQRTMSRGTCAVAEGSLTAGGLTFGLLRNGRWSQQVNIVEPGRFLAAGCVEDPGAYSIVIANDNPRGDATTAQLARIGWVLSTGTGSRD